MSTNVQGGGLAHKTIDVTNVAQSQDLQGLRNKTDSNSPHFINKFSANAQSRNAYQSISKSVEKGAASRNYERRHVYSSLEA